MTVYLLLSSSAEFFVDIERTFCHISTAFNRIEVLNPILYIQRGSSKRVIYSPQVNALSSGKCTIQSSLIYLDPKAFSIGLNDIFIKCVTHSFSLEYVESPYITFIIGRTILIWVSYSPYGV